MRCAYAGHDKRPYRVYLVERELAREVPVKLIEGHVRDGRCQRVHAHPWVQSQDRSRSRPAKLDQRKIVKANPGGHPIADAVSQRCPSLCTSLWLNVEGPAKTTPNERGDLEALDFKALCTCRRCATEGSSDSQKGDDHPSGNPENT